MLQIKDWRISTWIAGVLPLLVKSLPSVVSLECPHCGCAIDVRIEAGTLSSVFAIDWSAPRSSRSKHVLVVTQGARLSISCDRSQFVARQAQTTTGTRDGISSTRTSLEDLAREHGAGCCDELDPNHENTIDIEQPSLKFRT